MAMTDAFACGFAWRCAVLQLGLAAKAVAAVWNLIPLRQGKGCFAPLAMGAQ